MITGADPTAEVTTEATEIDEGIAGIPMMTTGETTGHAVDVAEVTEADYTDAEVARGLSAAVREMIGGRNVVTTSGRMIATAM